VKVSIVIPALNEEKNIGRIIREAKKYELVSEVLVVDGGSRDKTVKRAREAGARVITQSRKKFPGKGIAMWDGVVNSSGDVLVFTDADITNFKTGFIEKLVEPILVGEADFVKGYYERKAGRVTEITAKPLLAIFFPELQLRQPLSGEIAGNRELFLRMEFEEGWGIDIGILISAFLLKARIQEVNLGYKEHKMRPTGDLVTMSREVAQVIIRHGIKRKWWFLRNFSHMLKTAFGRLHVAGNGEESRMVIFDMDGTLLDGRFITELAKAKKLGREISKINREIERGKICEDEASRKIARLLKGMKKSELVRIASSIPLNRGVEKVVSELKRRGYRIAILSNSYEQVCEVVGNRIGADYILANKLETINDEITGRLKTPNFTCEENCGYSVCKLEGVRFISKILNVPLRNCILIGDDLSDAHAMKAVGIAVAFNASQEVREAATAVINKKDMSELLDYL